MRKRKFRIERETEKQVVESSILYGERKIKVYGYYIYFYRNLLYRIFGLRTYLELRRIEVDDYVSPEYDRYEYSKSCTTMFATSFDTRSDAENMIKLINEHPENFTLK